MPDILNTILTVAKTLFGLKGDLAKARRERKGEVAAFLSKIAQTVDDTAASLGKDIYPHGKCQELLTHSQHLPEAIGDLIGETKAKDLGTQLHEVWQIESLHWQLRDKPEAERERSLTVLAQAAGIFRATADFVAASP